MGETGFRVRFWGVRGSLPVWGSQYERYGGNTACVEVSCGGHRLLFDAGTGLRPAGEALLAEGVGDIDLMFTHCHYDHIMGLPFFAPLYKRGARTIFWSGHLAGQMTTADMIAQYMRPPWFPVEPDICCAKMPCRDFKSGDILQPRAGVTVRTASLNHPGGCIGYRVECGGKAMALISDTEHEPGALDPAVLGLIAGADLVIYDCTFTDEEMARYKGFGHSSWQQGVRLCTAAGARRLAMFHHDPSRADDALAATEAAAQAAFPGAFAARDGMAVDL